VTAAGPDVPRAIRERDDPAAERLLAAAEERPSAAGTYPTPSFLAGRTNAALEPLRVRSLEAGRFRTALDVLLQGT
jgi:hypothetical protein